MATNFSQIYRQELKGKGILSSIGAAALKGAKERMDVRNILFGGKGILGSTGQKVFGKGYSALSGSSSATVADDSMKADMRDLTQSSFRQEAILKVVAKNTMNMNYMARDMNITRQNIATFTKKLTGKSSRGADALFYGSAARSRMLDSKPQTQQTAPEKVGGSDSSVIGSVFSGLLGIGGSAGSFVLGGLMRSVMMLGPIFGIIGLAGAAYIVKRISEYIADSQIFDSISKSMKEFFGLDSESPDSIVRQFSERLDEMFGTTKFTDTLDYIEYKIDDVFYDVKKYTLAIFDTLGDVFVGVGKVMGYYWNEFFQSNKGKILGAIGAGIGAAFGAPFGPAVAAVAATAAGAAAGVVGYMTSDRDVGEIKARREELQKQIDHYEGIKKKQGGYLSRYDQRNLDKMVDENTTLGGTLRRKAREEGAAWQNIKGPITGSTMSGNLKRAEENLGPRPEFGKGYSKGTSSMAPSRMNSGDMADLIYHRFREAGFSDAQARGAIANAIVESSLNPNAKNLKGNDESYGLFQLNRKGGLGMGYSPEDLLDPEKNIQIAIAAAKESNQFLAATTAEEATKAFMIQVERPKNQSQLAIMHRISKLENHRGIELGKKSSEYDTAKRETAMPKESAGVVVNNVDQSSRSGHIVAPKAQVGDVSLQSIIMGML